MQINIFAKSNPFHAIPDNMRLETRQQYYTSSNDTTCRNRILPCSHMWVIEDDVVISGSIADFFHLYYTCHTNISKMDYSNVDLLTLGDKGDCKTYEPISKKHERSINIKPQNDWHFMNMNTDEYIAFIQHQVYATSIYRDSHIDTW